MKRYSCWTLLLGAFVGLYASLTIHLVIFPLFSDPFREIRAYSAFMAAFIVECLTWIPIEGSTDHQRRGRAGFALAASLTALTGMLLLGRYGSCVPGWLGWSGIFVWIGLLRPLTTLGADIEHHKLRRVRKFLLKLGWGFVSVAVFVLCIIQLGRLGDFR